MVRRRTAQQGFTLVELLVVVLILAILAALAIPRFVGQRNGAQNVSAKQAARMALEAAREYHADKGTYTGLTNTVLHDLQPALSASGPAGGGPQIVPGGGVDAVTPPAVNDNDPTRIWIGAYNWDLRPLASPDDVGVVLCSASRGDGIYCVRDNGQVSQFSSWRSAADVPKNRTWSPARATPYPDTGCTNACAKPWADAWSQ